jgi:chemotaxis protein CheX
LQYNSCRGEEAIMPLNGVRTGAIAHGGASRELEPAMTLSLRESLQLVSDPANLDATVEEVFTMMLGIACRRVDEPNAAAAAAGLQPALESETVTAVVGFGGLLSGACLFKSDSAAAVSIASLMTGMEIAGVDDTVKDGVGEICNMLAGAWKGKVPGLSANCGLSIPAVITGRDYNLHVQAPEFKLVHRYGFDGGSFEVTIICDSVQ